MDLFPSTVYILLGVLWIHRSTAKEEGNSAELGLIINAYRSLVKFMIIYSYQFFLLWICSHDCLQKNP